MDCVRVSQSHEPVNRHRPRKCKPSLLYCSENNFTTCFDQNIAVGLHGQEQWPQRWFSSEMSNDQSRPFALCWGDQSPLARSGKQELKARPYCTEPRAVALSGRWHFERAGENVIEHLREGWVRRTVLRCLSNTVTCCVHAHRVLAFLLQWCEI